MWCLKLVGERRMVRTFDRQTTELWSTPPFLPLHLPRHAEDAARSPNAHGDQDTRPQSNLRNRPDLRRAGATVSARKRRDPRRLQSQVGSLQPFDRTPPVSDGHERDREFLPRLVELPRRAAASNARALKAADGGELPVNEAHLSGDDLEFVIAERRADLQSSMGPLGSILHRSLK